MQTRMAQQRDTTHRCDVDVADSLPLFSSVFAQHLCVKIQSAMQYWRCERAPLSHGAELT